MANPCALHGGSIPDPARQNVVVFGAGFLGSYLNNKGIGWLLQYVVPAALGDLVFDLPTF